MVAEVSLVDCVRLREMNFHEHIFYRVIYFCESGRKNDISMCFYEENFESKLRTDAGPMHLKSVCFSYDLRYDLRCVPFS